VSNEDHVAVFVLELNFPNFSFSDFSCAGSRLEKNDKRQKLLLIKFSIKNGTKYVCFVMQEAAFPRLLNVGYSYKMKRGGVNPSHNFSISIVNFFQLSQSWVNVSLTSVSI